MKESEISLLQFDKRLLFLFLSVVFILLIFLRINFVESETALFDVLAAEGKSSTFRLINSFFYLAVPFFILGKVTLVACGLWVASFGIGYRLTFGKLWRVTLLGQAIFILPEMLRLLYFLFTPSDPSYFEVQHFYPLSVLQAMGTDSVEASAYYPLKMLNAFELLYWIFLISMMHQLARQRVIFAGLIVFLGYILPYLLWLGYQLLPPSEPL